MKQSVFEHIAKFFGRIHPILKRTVLFESFLGQYNDNPKYVFLELQNRNLKIKCIWVSNQEIEGFSNVKTVRYRSLIYWFYRYSCQVVIDNSIGISFKADQSGFGNRIRKFLATRSNQLRISTWHGTPLKRLGLDIITDNEYRQKQGEILTSNYILAGCGLTAKALSNAFQNSPSYPIAMTGTPRNDILIRNSEALMLHSKLGLPIDKKLLLFAPTFRRSIGRSGVEQMRQLDILRILAKMKQKFGGEWVFVLRVHHSVQNEINTGEYQSDYIIDGNAHPDMAEYLACSDALITDYSGSMFDFALTKKPCFLYVPDLDAYENEERGFYFDFEELPFPAALKSDDVIEIIDKFEVKEYERKVELFLDKIGNVEDGQAASRVVNCIANYVERNVLQMPIVERW